MPAATIEMLENWIGMIGALAVILVLTLIFQGIWRGSQRSTGPTSGRFPGLLHSPAYYALSSLVFFGFGYLLWKPLPLSLSLWSRVAALILGSLLFICGLALVAWARLALGKNYFVSTALGAQLFAGQQLITSGPFARIRHPMYLGLIISSFGGLLLYRTWTFVFIVIGFMALVLRARREEQALAAAFGQTWLEYCQRTPAWLPRLKL